MLWPKFQGSFSLFEIKEVIFTEPPTKTQHCDSISTHLILIVSLKDDIIACWERRKRSETEAQNILITFKIIYHSNKRNNVTLFCHIATHVPPLIFLLIHTNMHTLHLAIHLCNLQSELSAETVIRKPNLSPTFCFKMAAQSSVQTQVTSDQW